jgi:CheY-like chemotaxis protein
MKSKQILVIDDDEDLSYIICNMLENYSYNVSNAKDSASANVKCSLR